METYQIIQTGLVLIEAIAFITGLINWKKIRHSYWKWFVIYLGVIVVCEISGLLLLHVFEEGRASRSLYYYFVIPLEFLFICWLYFRYYELRKEGNLAIYAGLLYLLVFLINAIFIPRATIWLFPLSYLVGVLIMLVLVLQFFYRQMAKTDVLDFRRNMMFWVSLGLLVFYLVSSPYFGLRQLLYDRYPKVFWIYFYLQFGVNYLMYLFFTIAFIWGRPQ